MAKTSKFDCPHCSATITVPESLLGQTAYCPKCEQPVRFNPSAAVPAESSDEASTKPGDHWSGETTRLVTHPAMFRRRPFYYTLLMSALVGCLAAGAYWLMAGKSSLGTISLAVAVVPGVLLAAWWVQVISQSLTVTDKRSLFRRGIVSKETSEVLHDDVRNLQIDQSFFERITGVGDISISSSGQDDMEIVIKGIPNPEQVADYVRQNQ